MGLPRHRRGPISVLFLTYAKLIHPTTPQSFVELLMTSRVMNDFIFCNNIKINDNLKLGDHYNDNTDNDREI
jgi:hypothetical protein